MRWEHKKVRPLSSDQVESHIQQWTENAEKLERMSTAEARRFIGGKTHPDFVRFEAMARNMEHKIQNEAPSADARKRMLAAWTRRNVAYKKILMMLQSGVTTTTAHMTTTIRQIESRMCGFSSTDCYYGLHCKQKTNAVSIFFATFSHVTILELVWARVKCHCYYVFFAFFHSLFFHILFMICCRFWRMKMDIFRLCHFLSSVSAALFA